LDPFLAGRCAVLNDRTDAQRIEQQLQQAQKLESVGYLTAGIAHEINNPLAYLKANLGSLEELLLGLDDAAGSAPWAQSTSPSPPRPRSW
jgi:C4-dicarboxylate-specific signal transduction histidine kinase